MVLIRFTWVKIICSDARKDRISFKCNKNYETFLFVLSHGLIKCNALPIYHGNLLQLSFVFSALALSVCYYADVLEQDTRNAKRCEKMQKTFIVVKRKGWRRYLKDSHIQSKKAQWHISAVRIMHLKKCLVKHVTHIGKLRFDFLWEIFLSVRI